LTDCKPRNDGHYVLYWMTAFRRSRSNFALQRAIEWAERLQRPLLVVEAIRTHYRWSCDRFHQFLIDGMIDNAVAFAKSRATYYPYIEEKAGDGSGLVETLAEGACMMVADDFPCFFHPRLYEKIVRRWKVSVELVDSGTILPMRVADRTFTVAHSYRRFMQKEIPKHLSDFPSVSPLDDLHVPKLTKIDEKIQQRWPPLTVAELPAFELDRLPIDHAIKPTQMQGGAIEAQRVLERFVQKRLMAYNEARNEPEQDGSSWLSPYLHFGHISPHEVFSQTVATYNWDSSKLGKPNGKMNGFWNLDENAEAFLDQLLTWREIGFNMCWREPRYDRYDSLPNWALTTLKEHAQDPRPAIYSLDQFEQAQTHDELWNAAQRQLVREGRIHNYLRMLWGKKILHWTASPEDALHVMIELNNKYALDGRDPNSYSGIFWILGRYDRAWGPERPIFGKIRYMTSESTRNKFSVKKYIESYSSANPETLSSHH
jgi:deoxyribodipyrimidine photo-lyase